MVSENICLYISLYPSVSKQLALFSQSISGLKAVDSYGFGHQNVQDNGHFRSLKRGSKKMSEFGDRR